MHFSLCGLFVTCWKRKEKVVGIRENEQLFDRFVCVSGLIPCTGACKSDEMMTLGMAPTPQSNMRHSRSDGAEGEKKRKGNQ
jgi:hypothetical protein